MPTTTLSLRTGIFSQHQTDFHREYTPQQLAVRVAREIAFLTQQYANRGPGYPEYHVETVEPICTQRQGLWRVDQHAVITLKHPAEAELGEWVWFSSIPIPQKGTRQKLVIGPRVSLRDVDANGGKFPPIICEPREFELREIEVHPDRPTVSVWERVA